MIGRPGVQVRALVAQILLALALLSPGVAYARLYNYEDIPLGERSFGMGLSAMALEGDAASMYYNPGTLGNLQSSQVSASLSSYMRIDTRTGQFVSAFQSARDNVSRGGFLAVPSMVGGNFRHGPWVWGGTILVPASFKNSGNVLLGPRNAGAFESKTESVWMGAFVARKWDRHSVGVALFYASQEFDEKFFFIAQTDTTTTIRFVENSLTSTGFVAIAGATYDLTDNLRLGYSLRAPGWHLGGTGEYADASSDNTMPTRTESLRAARMALPLRAGVGIAWTLPPRWTLTADLKFYGPARGNLTQTNNAAFNLHARETANVSLGAEYRAWKSFGLRGGMYSNLSSAERTPTELSALNDKVNMIGATAALVFEKSTGSISLGGFAQGGQGYSMPMGAANREPVPRSNYVYGFVVASSYKF